MGNYVCRTNRTDTVDSIEPLERNVNRIPQPARNDEKKAHFDLWGKKRSSIERMPYRVEHLLEMNKVALEEQIKHGWNPNDKSVNIFVKGDNLTLHRRPISQSTDSIRGKVGYRKGIHMWEIKWISNQRGTHACVGVATKRAPIRKAGYCSLIGNNEHSWGWDLGRNILKHNEQQLAPACLQPDQENHNKLSYPPMDDSVSSIWAKLSGWCNGRYYQDTSYIVPSVFQCVLDMDAGTLGFMADGQWLGTAFSGLKGLCLYPVVSCVWGHCEVTMKYLNGLGPRPLTLKEQSRRAIRAAIPSIQNATHIASAKFIPLPISLKKYILQQGIKHHVRLQDHFSCKSDSGVCASESCRCECVTGVSTQTDTLWDDVGISSESLDSDDFL